MKTWMGVTLVATVLVAAQTADDNPSKMDGVWIMVRGEEDGKPVAKDVVSEARLTIEGDKHTIHLGPYTLIGRRKLDVSVTPHTIDVLDNEGPFQGQPMQGICQLRGDVFTVCFAPPGKPRPKEFASRPGTGYILHVWKRERK